MPFRQGIGRKSWNGSKNGYACLLFNAGAKQGLLARCPNSIENTAGKAQPRLKVRQARDDGCGCARDLGNVNDEENGKIENAAQLCR